jgi:hypothetical protein
MAGNATVFEFADANPTVRMYMNTAERALVTAWHPVNAGWQIELHPGHPTGEPFYIRIDGNKDKSNVPKADTLNFTAGQYANIATIKNWQKLSSLGSAKKLVLTTFIVANFTHLTLIAHRWWNDEVAPADPVIVVAAVDKACIHAPCAGRVPVVISGKAACNTCFKFQ